MKAKEDAEPLRTSSDIYVANETTLSDDEGKGVAQLADLPVADEQAYQTKGGPGARISKIIIDN